MIENEFGIPDGPQQTDTVVITAPAKKASTVKEDQWGRPYRLIRVEQENEKENYLPVGHNGVTYQIKRGIPVEVPQCVVDVLNDCIGAKLIETPDGRGGTDKVLQDYQTVPYSLLR